MCEIRCSIEGDYKDTCQDHKVLRNNTEHRTLLHIPNFTYSDVGNYSCETPYTGGAENILYHINIIAPPNISLRLEPSGDKMVAVCKAERASPAASIYWSLTSNHTMKTTTESDGLITVTSTVEINTPEEAQNMSCNITHPYWDQPRVVLVQNTNNSQRISQNWPVIYTTIVISVLFCLAMLIFGIKKVIHLRMKQTSSKPPPMDYVEEVEPYACYVQRVNTIYNSSREMFA
ncbi:cell surface glycoprotein CD200 receptor 1-A [Eucyclogobius newberryi]|uniref:cell surface glycoprotein CD200 receptor 1-A n=1 Tax=Eucyclogobius newberryi TaxID=166745 RepID=UPI003B5CDE8D